MTDGDPDDFDDFGDLEIDDDQLEETLQRAERQYEQVRASQSIAVQRNAANITCSPPPPKRQRMQDHPDRALAKSNRADLVRPGIDQTVVTYNGKPGAVGLGRDLQAVTEDDDEWWDMAETWDHLDAAQDTAVRLSQMSQQAPPQMDKTSPLKAAATAARVNKSLHQARSVPAPPRQMVRPLPNVNGSRGGTAETDLVKEVELLRRKTEELRKQNEKALDQLRNERKERQAKDGEVKVVRARMAKLDAENSAMRQAELVRERDYKAELLRLREAAAEEMRRQDTAAAFNRIEQETSRRTTTAWPSSARRRTVVSARSMAPLGGAEGHQTPSRRSGPSSRDELGSQGSPSRQSAASGPSLLVKSTRTPRRPVFAGFEDSFALGHDPVALRRGAASMQAKPTSINDRKRQINAAAAFSLTGDAPIPEALDMGLHNDEGMELDDLPDTPQARAVTSGTSAWRFPRDEFTWSVSELARRRAHFVAQVLSHTSLPCPPPERSQSWLLRKSSEERADGDAATLQSANLPVMTAYRLFHLSMPPTTDENLSKRFASATEHFLDTLARGMTSDGEARFAHLSQQLHTFKEGIGVEEKRVLEDGSFRKCESAIVEGMLDLYEGVASALLTMMGIFVRVGQTDALCDALRLCDSLCLPHLEFQNRLLDSVESIQSEGASQQPRQHVQAIEAAADVDNEEMGDASNVQAAAQQPATGTPCRFSAILAETVWIGCGKWPIVQSGHYIELDIGEKGRQQLWDCLLSLLETLTWSACANVPEQGAIHPSAISSRLETVLKLFDTPGLIPAILDAKRSSQVLTRFTLSLVQLVRFPRAIPVIVSFTFDDRLQPEVNAIVKNSKTPLLEILARHLVDRAVDRSPEEAHELHISILLFLSQIIVKQPGVVGLAFYTSLLAALVKSLATDTDSIWTIDGVDIDGTEKRIEHIIERIRIDLQLLAHIYLYPENAHSLSEALDSRQTNRALSGARHSFVLAAGRIAYAPEPGWLEEYGAGPAKQLELAGSLASELLDMVLSPDEIDEVWKYYQGSDEEDLGETADPNGMGVDDPEPDVIVVDDDGDE